MTSWRTYSFYNESVRSLGLSVETDHRPNNPIPETNAEFTILIPICECRWQTQNQRAFNLNEHLHTHSTATF